MPTTSSIRTADRTTSKPGGTSSTGKPSTPSSSSGVGSSILSRAVSPAADLASLIGRTPLVRLRGASEKTGCEILGKAEFLNPGQSVKDRAALYIVRDAEQRGELQPGGTIVEGTAGNTGVGLALIGNALGYRTVIVMPETQSQEKQDALRLCGAELHLVKAVPYANPGNYVHVSQRLAAQLKQRGGNAIWGNQFDNVANRRAHFDGTGPEIWQQTSGRVDAFTCAVGTGGTLAGVGSFLKSRAPGVKVVLSDPMGSALYHYYESGELRAEGSSITEGIGQGRVTANLQGARIDGALQVTDDEALRVLFDLVGEGLILGGSSGINVAGAIKLAERMGPGHTIVTILCDHGSRYASKLYNPTFLAERGFPIPSWLNTTTATNDE